MLLKLLLVQNRHSLHDFLGGVGTQDHSLILTVDPIGSWEEKSWNQSKEEAVITITTLAIQTSNSPSNKHKLN
jgi:hypothetical protein